MAVTALVLGASGFIGSRLVDHLTQGNVNVIAFDIAPPRNDRSGVRYITGDIRQPICFELEDKIDRIYNLAAIHRTPGHPSADYFDTNVWGAINAAKFAEINHISEIIFTSSISVYGPSDLLKTEMSPPAPSSAYGKSKLMAERIHQSWQEGAEGRRLIIIRPGVVFGPGEKGNYTRLAKTLKRGLFAYPGDSNVVKSGGYIDELMLTIDFALRVGGKLTLYNFAYPELDSLRTIVMNIDAIQHNKGGHPTIPKSLMVALAIGCEALNQLGLKNSVHRERIEKLVTSTKISPKWLIDNGYKFKSKLPTALEQWREESNGTFD